MTYSELKSLIQDYLQNTETSFVSNINNIIKQAEERILKTVKLPVFRKNVEGSLASGNKYLATPTDFLDNFSLAVINGGYKEFLYYKDVNFIREAYPNASTTGTPKHYGLFDDTSFIVGPTPDSDYSVELHYFYRPASITAGADSGTTWLATNAVNALLYGSLLESYVYMKGEPDVMNMYEKRFLEALGRLKSLAEGENTVDNYTEGAVRINRT